MANFQELILRNDLDTYDYRIDLAGETFRFQFIWNEREERYHFVLFNVADVRLAEVPLTLDNNLFERFRSREPRIPQGTLFTVRKSGSTLEPNRADHGVDFFLYFADVILEG